MAPEQPKQSKPLYRVDQLQKGRDAMIAPPALLPLVKCHVCGAQVQSGPNDTLTPHRLAPQFTMVCRGSHKPVQSQVLPALSAPPTVGSNLAQAIIAKANPNAAKVYAPPIPRFLLLLEIDGIRHHAEAVREHATNRVIAYEVTALPAGPDTFTIHLEGPMPGMGPECNCLEYLRTVVGKKPAPTDCRHIQALRATGVLRDDEDNPPSVEPAAC